MSSLNLTNNFASRTMTSFFTSDSGNASNGGWCAQGAIRVGRDAGWNGKGRY